MIRYSDIAVKRAILRTAEEVLVSAKANCPVRTGRLKNSLTRDGAVVFTDVEYAAAVEFGTSRQKPQPYLSKGITEAKKKAAAIFKEELL